VAVLFLLEGGELAQYLNPTIPIKALKRYNKWSLFKMYECYSELKNTTYCIAIPDMFIDTLN